MTTTTAPTGRAVANQLSPFHIIVQMVLESARHSQIAARIWAALCLVAVLVFGPLEWRWDMQPTLLWLQAHGLVLQATLAAAYGQAIASSLLLILPLVTKGLTAQLAPQIKLLSAGFLAAELFDLVTNWSAAWELFYSFAPQWRDAWPTDAGQALLAWVGFLVTLLVTTTLFQVLFIGSALCLVVALFNSFRSRLAGYAAVSALGGVVVWWMTSLG